ncbi:MAG: hypothetical protein ACI9GH_000663 [Candidatus Paceibacteria bacterium]|jgi:hypothetical protein
MSTKHTIDLSKEPRLPFDNAVVEKHDGKGIVEIELRSDDNLYLGGKKVELFLSERQKGISRIVGHKLRKELKDAGKVLLNSNVLDYIFDHQELFPEHWKKVENGKTRCTFFQNSTFRRPSNDKLYACYLCWCGVSLDRSYYCLDSAWDSQDPSALLAS